MSRRSSQRKLVVNNQLPLKSTSSRRIALNKRNSINRHQTVRNHLKQIIVNSETQKSGANQPKTNEEDKETSMYLMTTSHADMHFSSQDDMGSVMDAIEIVRRHVLSKDNPKRLSKKQRRSLDKYKVDPNWVKTVLQFLKSKELKTAIKLCMDNEKRTADSDVSDTSDTTRLETQSELSRHRAALLCDSDRRSTATSQSNFQGHTQCYWENAPSGNQKKTLKFKMREEMALTSEPPMLCDSGTQTLATKEPRISFNILPDNSSLMPGDYSQEDTHGQVSKQKYTEVVPIAQFDVAHTAVHPSFETRNGLGPVSHAPKSAIKTPVFRPYSQMGYIAQCDITTQTTGGNVNEFHDDVKHSISYTTSGSVPDELLSRGHSFNSTGRDGVDYRQYAVNTQYAGLSNNHKPECSYYTRQSQELQQTDFLRNTNIHCQVQNSERGSREHVSVDNLDTYYVHPPNQLPQVRYNLSEENYRPDHPTKFSDSYATTYALEGSSRFSDPRVNLDQSTYSKEAYTSPPVGTAVDRPIYSKEVYDAPPISRRTEPQTYSQEIFDSSNYQPLDIYDPKIGGLAFIPEYHDSVYDKPVYKASARQDMLISTPKSQYQHSNVDYNQSNVSKVVTPQADFDRYDPDFGDISDDYASYLIDNSEPSKGDNHQHQNRKPKSYTDSRKLNPLFLEDTYTTPKDQPTRTIKYDPLITDPLITESSEVHPESNIKRKTNTNDDVVTSAEYSTHPNKTDLSKKQLAYEAKDRHARCFKQPALSWSIRRQRKNRRNSISPSQSQTATCFTASRYRSSSASRQPSKTDQTDLAAHGNSPRSCRRSCFSRRRKELKGTEKPHGSISLTEQRRVCATNRNSNRNQKNGSKRLEAHHKSSSTILTDAVPGSDTTIQRTNKRDNGLSTTRYCKKPLTSELPTQSSMIPRKPKFVERDPKTKYLNTAPSSPTDARRQLPIGTEDKCKSEPSNSYHPNYAQKAIDMLVKQKEFFQNHLNSLSEICNILVSNNCSPKTTSESEDSIDYPNSENRNDRKFSREFVNHRLKHSKEQSLNDRGFEHLQSRDISARTSRTSNVVSRHSWRAQSRDLNSHRENMNYCSNHQKYYASQKEDGARAKHQFRKSTSPSGGVNPRRYQVKR